MRTNFCTEGIHDAKYYSFEFVEFDSEEAIFDILLDVLRSQLPERLSKIKDCEDKPMIITEDSIGLHFPRMVPKFSVVLNPLGDVPKYAESRMMREVEFNFEIILTVQNTVQECITWELLRFKNVVETLIMSTELYLDGYNSAVIEPRGFVYLYPDQSEGAYYRQGAYRFAVTVTQTKNNIGQ